MQRCYCGHSGGSFTGSILKKKSHVSRLPQPQPTPLRSDLYSLTSSSRQSVRPTQFIKRPNPKSSAELGLGHSKSALSRDFSRRNSAATTLSHCSSCCSSCTPQQQRESRVKVLSWGLGAERETNTSNDTHCEHTDNRRLYEQRACVASQLRAQGQVHGHVQSRGTATPTSPTVHISPTPEHNAEMHRLLSLQQFRLRNASECFSAQRQDELRLQQAYDKLGVVADELKWQKDKANESRQQQQAMSGATPYALRQKLLQLQLREEQKSGRGSGALCAPIEKSCALRYN